jgi:hypothetical protein
VRGEVDVDGVVLGCSVGECSGSDGDVDGRLGQDVGGAWRLQDFIECLEEGGVAAILFDDGSGVPGELCGALCDAADELEVAVGMAG